MTVSTISGGSLGNGMTMAQAEVGFDRFFLSGHVNQPQSGNSVAPEFKSITRPSIFVKFVIAPQILPII
jgi:hypothetical protein